MSDYSDNDTIVALIKAGKRGDHGALTRLIDMHASSVHNLIFSILHDNSVVEDLAQETFIRMFMSLHHYQFRAPFRSWLFRIAVNLCRDHLRKKKVRKIITRFQVDENSGEEQSFIDQDQDPTAFVQNSERMRLISNALEKLPESSRIVFVLREMKNLSYEEIAKTLSWKIGTVKSRLFRARRELADLLGPDLEELR
ncbi:RNA polymerase sigma factor [candidate division KSB1 bacterium]|nr:RNA polymerase sigma factor [candidate division KSB1 bacterium]